MNLPDVGQVYRGAVRHEVLNSASAIAFQVLFALVPLVLVFLALVGFFDVDRVWKDAADQIKPNMSPAAFNVVNDTVQRIITQQQPFWLTMGAALAIWRLSATMRATMHALDLVYGADEHDRSLVERLRTSILLSLAIAVLLVLALALIYLGPVAVSVDGPFLGAVSFLVRWLGAIALLLGAIGLTLRHAPAAPQPIEWVSVGSVLCAVAWMVSTAAFAFYVTDVADYGSVFGSFASIFVLLSYLYLAATSFLVGAEIDAQLRKRA